jgi:hypothetical protein
LEKNDTDNSVYFIFNNKRLKLISVLPILLQLPFARPAIANHRADLISRAFSAKFI